MDYSRELLDCEGIVTELSGDAKLDKATIWARIPNLMVELHNPTVSR